MEPEQLRCHGCKSAINSVFCADCDIKHCAQDKGAGYCFECSEFPCSRLTSFRHDEHAHHSVVLQNQEAIRSQGADRWLEQQRQRWSCPVCGARFSWYDMECAACGGPLYSCVEEEQDLPRR
jgi:hypothetical protein